MTDTIKLQQALMLIQEAQQKLAEASDILTGAVVKAPTVDRQPTAVIQPGSFVHLDMTPDSTRTGSLILHNYRVLSTLSKDVYKVENLTTGEIEVAKRADRTDTLRVQEIYNSHKLHNKAHKAGIEGMHKVIETERDIYGISRYIPGENLADFIQTHGAMTYEEILPYFHKLLLLVQNLHSHHIIHRDLKPENVIVDMDNTLHIIDMDIAMETTEEGYAEIKTAVGTRQYAAPETYYAGSRITCQSDIYSIGRIAENIFSHTAYPGKIREMWQKCQSREQNKRYRTVDEIIKQIDEGM